jgi:hypothetical protein
VSSTFYSVIPEQNLVIQGRPLPFDANDEVPLGFKTTAQENFSLRLDQLDGLFETQDIFIEDKLLGIIHNLKQSPYAFSSAVGTFNDRLVLRYNNSALGTNHPKNQFNLYAHIQNNLLLVESQEQISEIEVFDLTGKLVLSQKLNQPQSKYQLPFIYAEGIYLLKAQMNDGSLRTQKVIAKK